MQVSLFRWHDNMRQFVSRVLDLPANSHPKQLRYGDEWCVWRATKTHYSCPLHWSVLQLSAITGRAGTMQSASHRVVGLLCALVAGWLAALFGYNPKTQQWSRLIHCRRAVSLLVSHPFPNTNKFTETLQQLQPQLKFWVVWHAMCIACFFFFFRSTLCWTLRNTEE